MTARRRVIGAIGGAVGIAAAAAGTAVAVRRQQRSIDLDAGDAVPFGTLRTTPITVVADDGLPLHVEVEEAAEPQGGRRGRGRGARVPEVPDVTVVFAHGYCLNLDAWHFQRAAYRGLVRAVYYDQRSHGRSGRSDREHASIDQLGHDLRAVIDQVVPDGPVVLVGHSMGGMTICALAEHYPEMIGDKVIGVALVSTTAGGLDPSRILLPMLPARLTSRAAHRAVATLAVGHGAVDQARRVGRFIANAATQRFAFGGEVPHSYVSFVDDMLSATSFEVVADFFPHLGKVDKFEFIEVLDGVPVSIICGTADRLTSVGHSRKLHVRIPTSRLVECDGAGHMVLFERHDQVNAELDQLITAATTRAAAR